MSQTKESYSHIPVLPKEVMEYLEPKKGMTAVDTTAGGGGHLKMILDAVSPSGKVIALDQDLRAHQPDAAGGLLKKYKNLELHHASFSKLPEILAKSKVKKIDRLLCDLGTSSPQFDDASRGFSFQKDGPLDMRMNSKAEITAYDLINQTREEDLANIIYKYGEERKSRAVAKAIKRSWPIKDSTLELANLIAKSIKGKRQKIHPATRTFQALRIAVNHELAELESLLEYLPEILAFEGRAVIISFHSLEDRLVKHAFRKFAAKSLNPPIFKILTKKPAVPNKTEIIHNKRARSAKLRAVEACKPNS